MVSPVVRMEGGSKAAKKGWKVRNCVAPAPVLPASVEAEAESCQVVMLSATGKWRVAAPSGVVMISGRQRRVSGK